MSETSDRRRTFVANALMFGTIFGLCALIKTSILDFEEGKRDTTPLKTEDAVAPVSQSANETAFILLPISPL